ncbi:MAG: hypothetical protein NTY98_02855 [Verrucomicrobia bacterium]|nr:hypothetical protein [Verrucomicrobiota bacterium]
MKLNSQDKPRSNSAIVISGWVSMFVLCFVGFRIQHSQPRLASLIGFGSFSLVFVAAGLAQLRSGYLMSNLSPGNRGAHRSEAPYRFMASTIFYFALALAIVGVAMWLYWQGE